MKLSHILCCYLYEDQIVGFSKDDIKPTIEFLSNIIGIDSDQFHVVGSAAKKLAPKDIDLTIDGHKYDLDKIHSILTQHLGDNNVFYNRHLKSGSYQVPIAGDPSRGNIQVDIIGSKNINWTKFSHGSPGDDSKFSGADRNVLLSIVASFLHIPNVDLFVIDPETKQWMIRIGQSYDFRHGLKRTFHMRRRNEHGNWNRHIDPVTPEEITATYPEVSFDPRKFSIRDPNKIAQSLFGSGVTAKDIESVEQVIALVKQKFSLDKSNQILQMAAKRIKTLDKQ